MTGAAERPPEIAMVIRRWRSGLGSKDVERRLYEPGAASKKMGP